jgi:tetratricopeptide (TPR) repeat protein
MTSPRRLVGILLLAVATCAPAGAADAPTAEEWAPVEQALGGNAADAEERLVALLAAYPRWADGQRTLAQWRLDHGQTEAALAEAQRALQSAPNDAAAAAIAVQALGKLERPAEAYAIAERFVGEKDTRGWVNFRAAVVALEAGDRAKAELHLSLANGRAKTPPAEFAYLDARISEVAGDFDRAELSLNRAVAASPRLWDAWYELGVVQLKQAERKTAGTRRDYLQKSEGSFAKVTSVTAKDALAWLGQGIAQLSLGQDLLIDRPEDGKAKAREAVRSLRNALEIRDDLRDAHLNLGIALLIGDQHDEAITHLLRARDLGVVNRTLGFNLMLAYQKAGRSAEFEAEARNVQAVSVAEKLTAGIGFYRAGNHALAVELLTAALPQLGEDRERVAAAYRYIGHAHAGLAAEARTGGQADPTAVAQHLDAAREAWRKSANLRDQVAQRFFMGQETARSPLHGYEAGWQLLRWQDYGSLDGWAAVVGNYGGAVTGGEGIVGMWNRHPLHVIVWGALAFLPLLLALASFLRPRPEEQPVERRPESGPQARPPQRAPVPGAKPSTKISSPNHKSAVRTPAPRTPAPASRPATPAAPRSAVPQPVVRTPKPVAPKPPVRSQVETEPTLRPVRDQRTPRVDEAPPAKAAGTEPALRPGAALERKTRKSGEFDALERRTPRPDDGPGSRA